MEMVINKNFVVLDEKELSRVDGGDWIGGELVEAVFECGRKLGNAIGDAIWG